MHTMTRDRGRVLLPRRREAKPAPRRSLGPLGWLAVGAAIVTPVLVAGAVVVDQYGRVDRAFPSGAIVVLGARVDEGGVASPTLRERALQGARLHAEGLAPVVIFSGGVGTFGPSEASVACEVAVARGLPRSACVLEERSHSTAQNAAEVAKILRARGISEVILVTDPYHLLRARQCFWREGIRVNESPVVDAPREVEAPIRAWWTLREVIALAAHPSLLFVEPPDL